MKTTKCISIALCAFLLNVALSGCATMSGRGAMPDPIAQVTALIRAENAGDARYLRVRGREYLVFDQDLKSRLAGHAVEPETEAKRALILQVLADAKALGDKAVDLQLKRISPEKISAVRPDLSQSYRDAASAELEAETGRVKALAAAADLDRYARDLDGAIEESIKTKGRTFRQFLLLPLAPFTHIWMSHHTATEVRERGGVEYAEVDLYEPPPAAQGDVKTMSDEVLLAYYAPTLAIEKKQNIKYDPKSDRFGAISMEGAEVAKAQPAVNTDDPVVYGYTETKTVQGTPVKMLVYTLWFPERPNIDGGFDPEVGTTQGAIIRISLDRANKPVVYENVSSCGCYYKVFPTEALEERSRQKYGAPLEKRHFVLESDVPGKIDANIPTLVGAGGRVTAFFSSGKHEVMDIRTQVPSATKAVSRAPYKLLPYEQLESLPFNGATISMFGADGLVRSADRMEATLLAASGMYHPGTPRQRGTLMIYFDQADFDDPQLLENYLRLPDHAFEAAS